MILGLISLHPSFYFCSHRYKNSSISFGYQLQPYYMSEIQEIVKYYLNHAGANKFDILFLILMHNI
jgi:hypothetical protein